MSDFSLSYQIKLELSGAWFLRFRVQVIYSFQKLENKILIITDNERVTIYSSAMLHIKLWLIEDNGLHKFLAFK